ncbi:MAG: pyridoxal-phosphate dependent enzyme, partial [Thaumarchaeota archaeon]|nr:pyridoxal-phosphate dependent enzyme [Nitrososphaerota archaeon]
IKNPETIATAIRIGNPASWKEAQAARDESGGIIDSVTDDQILEAYKRLAGKTGIFVEPASAASIAGILKLNQQGFFKDYKNARIVCTVTGHGLKDPNVAINNVAKPATVKADIKVILKEIGL